jgi:hypothetical protein
MISAPHSASASAAAWPIPLVPPVITAVCPSRENIEKAEGAAMFDEFKLRYCLGDVGCLSVYRCDTELEILPSHSDARAEKRLRMEEIASWRTSIDE